MTDGGRIVVIGAGHNGLVCAAYLARAGRRVLVLEAADEIGGAAVTREFAPGYRVSAVAHLLNVLDHVVVRELRLKEHGLALARAGLATVALSATQQSLVIDAGLVTSGTLADTDREALASFHRRMQGFAATIGRQHGRIPPRLAWATLAGAWPAAALALDIRRLGREDMREFLRIATMAIHDVLEESFASPLLKGALALDGVLGTKLGPRSGGSTFNYLHRMSGTGALARFNLPKDGMGSVTAALAAAARAAGAEIRTGCVVAAILADGGRATGVRLGDGTEIAAGTVISSADPKTTLLGLLGGRHLEAEVARRVTHLRSTGTAAKLHLALSARPAFHGVAHEHVGERLVVCPSLDYADRAFNPAKYRAYSEEPVFEITIPSVHDPGLAPAGHHVLSAIVQYAPYDLDGGWDAHRDRFRDLAIGVLERHAPGLAQTIVAAELLTPRDIEREFRITGGHWHHGELALDQFLMLRPFPGAAQYAMPLPGLFLCGAGCHPGGGVMGSAGRNAARVVLAGGKPP